MVITKGSNSEKCNVASPLEAYFSHHKDRKKKISASVFLFTKREEKLCCSRYMTQVFPSLVTFFVPYWIKGKNPSIGHTKLEDNRNVQKDVGGPFAFLDFQPIWSWTLSSFLLENFALDAIPARNMEVLWQTQKASQAYFKCGQNFSLSFREKRETYFHFNFQHLSSSSAEIN